MPTLILHNTGDRTVPVESSRYMAERIPGAKYVELPGVDHVPYAGNSDAILDEIEKNWKPDGVSSFWIATVHAALREHDAAFGWLERAFQERAAFMVFLKINALFRGLHGDPRFETLVKRIGASA